MIAPFLAAVRFMTRIPAPDPGELDERQEAMSALFFPMIGLLLGLVLWGVAVLLSQTPVAVTGALLLGTWVWATGALHLDGLADSADAWIGGLGSRERTLEIMKDPRIGSAGVVALVVVLIAKWSAIVGLMETSLAVLLWIPAIARGQLLLLFLTTPYAGCGGLGARLSVILSPRDGWAVLTLIWVACALTMRVDGLVLAMAAAATFALWRLTMMERINGFTGDTAGALVELSEVVMLLAFVVYKSN